MKTPILIWFLLLLLNNNPVESRFLGPSRQVVHRRNCILYNSPSKEYCDKKFPNRISAKKYREMQSDMGFSYIFIIAAFVIIGTIC